MNPIADEILSYYGHADTIASEEPIDISEMLHTDSNPVQEQQSITVSQRTLPLLSLIFLKNLILIINLSI